MNTLNYKYILVVAVLSLFPNPLYAGDADGVKKTFADYRSAVLDQRGKDAVQLLSKATIDEYQKYVDWALKADKKTLESLSMMNRLQVMTLRHRVEPETLRKLTGKSAIIHAVDRNWIGKNGVIRTSLGKIDVVENSATAEVIIGERKTPQRFQFNKENGVWKFDLVRVMMNINAAFKETAKRAGMSENEFIFHALESISGKKVDDSIWVPVGKEALQK